MPPLKVKWKTDLEKGVVTSNFEVRLLPELMTMTDDDDDDD